MRLVWMPFAVDTSRGYPVPMVVSVARRRTQVARLLARLLMVLALVAGIAAMHTLLDAPMTQAMPAAHSAMHISSPGMSTNGALAEASPAAAAQASPATHIADSATLPSMMTSMNDAEMHACLFLVMVAVFLAMLLPAFGDRMPISALRGALRRWLNTAVSGNDRTLALQVLRI
jgi:hypothetical protein